MQWIQAYNFTLSDYLMIVATPGTEFPHYGVVVLLGGVDTILLASKQPLMPDREKLAQLQQTLDGMPELTADFNEWLGGSDLTTLLVQHYQVGKEQLDRLVAAEPLQTLNTDLDLRLEFDAPLYLFHRPDESNMVMQGLTAATNVPWREELARHLGLDPKSAQFFLKLADRVSKLMSNPRLTRTLTQVGQLDYAADCYQRV